ncbi:MAG: transcriptional regulator NrdR [Proteobacteria bacterium]|nr:MAG: transcriptional regulator NrdR [Pseudomonadota bacterium]
MRCPFCSSDDTRVIDSRLGDDGASVRRRRECQSCSERFNTFERAEIDMPWVIKNDGSREAFDEGKLRRGMLRALEKRPITADVVEHAVSRILRRCAHGGERELSSKKLGEWIMMELREIDHVAYVRFASVYRRFQDLDAFSAELDMLRSGLTSDSGTQLSFLESGRKRGKR